MSERLNDRVWMLREMGIGPLWRRRNGQGGPTTDAIERKAQAEAPHGVGVLPPARQAAPQGGHASDAEAEAAEAIDVAALDWTGLEAAIRTCTRCKLAGTRTQAVPGVGDRKPSWFVLGEGPGEQEDHTGEPFVGPAGRLLDAMLAAVGKRRGEGVYITNVVKCRPPGNRNPEPEEIAACRPWLERQLALAQPRLILAVGKFAAQTALGREDTVASLRARGGPCALRGSTAPVAVTYHPSYLLRTPADKAKAWEDLQRARALTGDDSSGSAIAPSQRD